MSQARKRRAPKLPSALQNALALHRSGRLSEAERAYRETLAGHPNHPQALHGLGTLFYQRDQLTDARQCLEAAVARKARQHGAWYELGNVRRDLGDIAGAVEAYQRTLQHAPDFAPAHGALARLRDHAEPDAHAAEFKALQQAYARSRTGTLERRDLAWGLASASEQRGEVEATLNYLTEAHAVDASRQPFDLAGSRRYFDDLRSAIDKDFIAAHTETGSPSELPVFVCGLPRSGTTLVEQILDSHSACHGGGELRLIAEFCADLEQRSRQPFAAAFSRLSAKDISGVAGSYVKSLRSRAPLATRVVDKMPANFLALPMLAVMFPGARFVHCRRAPLATCWSIYSTRFDEPHRFANTPADLGGYYRLYHDYMQAVQELLGERLYHVDYEALVTEPDKAIPGLLDACGLSSEPACFAPQDNPRPVRTASTLQVRRQINTAAVARHRPFTDSMPALGTALGDLA